MTTKQSPTTRADFFRTIMSRTKHQERTGFNPECPKCVAQAAIRGLEQHPSGRIEEELKAILPYLHSEMDSGRYPVPFERVDHLEKLLGDLERWSADQGELTGIEP